MRSAIVVNGQNGLAQQFDNLRHDARGGANLLAHQMLGYLELPDAPTDSQTITFDINGNNVVLTAVGTIGTSAGNVLNPGTAAGFAANVLALLQQPQTTTANGVALSTANQQFLSYLAFSLVGTTIYVSSNNNSLYGPLSSFSASTTVSSASWTAQTMQLYVEPGVVYVGGTRVIFSGSSTPTVTAPSSNPRIDVLTVDDTGTLAWTTGTEASSPSAPTYPANKVALCELYNVVGETALYDYENQQSGEGYISTDVRPTIGTAVNLGAVASDILPDADGSRNLGSASFEWGTVYAKDAILVNGAGVANAKFGGTGTDGALSVTSGTTTVNAANNSVFIANYTSISITGTGVVAFSSPATNGTIIYLRSQGDVTLTSSATPMLDGSGMGGAGGAVPGSASTSNAGSNGITLDLLTHGGGAGITGTSGSASGGAAYTLGMYALSAPIMAMGLKTVYTGSGGGSGVWNSASKNVQGGNGGGAFIIECGGAYNFTTAGGISVAGIAGGGTTSTLSVSGGGGGSAGMCLVIYNSLTANSGTVTATGGAGGGSSNSGGSGNPAPGGGAGAGSARAAGGNGGGAAELGSAGQAGGNAGGVGAGGGGASGWGGSSGSASGGTGGGNDTSAYLAVQNYWFT